MLFRNSQGVEARGTLIRLSRNSAVFEVYNPYSIVQLSEVLTEFHIRRGERSIYTGRAVVSNLVSTGLLVIVSVTLVDPWSDLIDLSPGPELRREVRGFIRDWESSHGAIRPRYELMVSKVRNFLEELSRWLEQGETVAGIREPGMPEQTVRQFMGDVEEVAGPKLNELFGEFEQEAVGVRQEELVSHKAFARRELHPLMLCAPFVHRTYTKPLGYAGDYEMVNMMLRDPWEGANAYAKLVNAAILRSATAQGHRNRIVKLVEYLESQTRRVAVAGYTYKILNVGCGPAHEVQEFFKKDPGRSRCEFWLLDFNQQTLEYAKSRLSPAAGDERVHFVHRSIHELLKKASQGGGAAEPKYDMVYCAGLFDYLSDRICGRLLKLFHEWTLPGGLVMATNVHVRNPIRGTMEHLAEWYLVHRDEKDMLGLEPRLGRQAVSTDETGTNVFLEIRKPMAGEGGL